MHYIRYLRQQELLPLTTLFSINTSSEHYNESEKTGVFYGQSWALVHYLMLGDRGRQDQFKRFLSLIARGDSSAKAIEDAFGVTLPRQGDCVRRDFTAPRAGTARVHSPRRFSDSTHCEHRQSAGVCGLHGDAAHVAFRRRSELLPRRSVAAQRSYERRRALLQTRRRARSELCAGASSTGPALRTAATLCGGEEASGESRLVTAKLSDSLLLRLCFEP